MRNASRAIRTLLLAVLGGPSVSADEIRAAWYNFYRLPPLREQAEPLMQTHVRALRSMGINRLYVLVKTPDGFVFFDSRRVPLWSAEMVSPQGRKVRVGLDWDPLAGLIALGGRHGIDVRPYVNVFCEGGEDAEDRPRNPLLTDRPEWAVQNRLGQRLGWASPAIPQVVDYELGILLEIAARYDIRGIQLDRIRMPSGTEEAGAETRTVRGKRVTLPAPVDYNPETVRRFRVRAGRPPAGDDDPEWVRFRQDLVSDFVAQAGRELKRAKPGLSLSVSVFPDPAAAARQQFQDWERWAREGWVDEICTMAYVTPAAAWEELVRREQAAAGGRAVLLPGIGAHAFDRPEQLEGHIAAARRAGAPGYILFNAFSLFEKKGFHAALMGMNR